MINRCSAATAPSDNFRKNEVPITLVIDITHLFKISEELLIIIGRFCKEMNIVKQYIIAYKCSKNLKEHLANTRLSYTVTFEKGPLLI